MAQIYRLPPFLEGIIDRKKYIRWLQRKVTSHARRDRLRLNKKISLADYKRQIHMAVDQSNGVDWYTGEPLDWEKISSYDNIASKAQRSIYKATLALLPTVDHVLTSDGNYDFVICAWRTNDSKSDLSLPEFVQLCQRVIKLHG